MHRLARIHLSHVRGGCGVDCLLIGLASGLVFGLIFVVVHHRMAWSYGVVLGLIVAAMILASPPSLSEPVRLLFVPTPLKLESNSQAKVAVCDGLGRPAMENMTTILTVIFKFGFPQWIYWKPAPCPPLDLKALDLSCRTSRRLRGRV